MNCKINTPFDQLLQMYENALCNLANCGLGSVATGSIPSYKSGINTLATQYPNLIDWINQGLSAAKKGTNLEESIEQYILQQISPNRLTSNQQSYLRMFLKYVCSYISGPTSINFTVSEETLVQIVASNAIFASADVVMDVMNGNFKYGPNVYASWYNCKYRRGSQKKGTVVGGIIIDDNTSANRAIKTAVCESFARKGIACMWKVFDMYEACHIWDVIPSSGNTQIRSAYDEKFYSSIPNLVLIPRGLAALSDHNQAVKDCLQARAYDLFNGCKDTNGNSLIFPVTTRPTPPSFYKKLIWR